MVGCRRLPRPISPGSAGSAEPVPVQLRDQIRIEATVRGNSVSMFECRPPWHGDLTEWSKVRVAQLRYSTDSHQWSLYWADRNGRWRRYDDIDPGPVDRLLDEIEGDPTCIFWG